MTFILSEAKKLNPFDNPQEYPNFSEKKYSQDELFSFARYLLYETNFYGIDNKTYIGDYLKQWEVRQTTKIWD